MNAASASSLRFTDRLLSELERQDKYLSKLPAEFDFPLFNAKTGVESQRQNGYRGTASAVRELVDNAIEAGREVYGLFAGSRR